MINKKTAMFLYHALIMLFCLDAMISYLRLRIKSGINYILLHNVEEQFYTIF